MNKNCKGTLGATLLLTTAFSVTEGMAQTCAIPPTCESLGYTMSEADCEGAVIKCPFDTTKVYCPKLAQDGSGDYPCSSKYYITLSSGSFKDDCNYSSLSATDSSSLGLRSAQIICRATNAAPSNFPSSTYFGKGILARQNCESAFRYASQNKVVGCCNADGNVTVSFPPMLEVTGVKPPVIIGQDYYIDGSSVGTIVWRSFDSSGNRTGAVATLVGMATKTEASTICANYKAGGLTWTLASGYNACRLGQYKSDLKIGSHPYWVMTTNGYGICSSTNDLNDTSYHCSMNPDSNSQCKEDALHQVVCQASF